MDGRNWDSEVLEEDVKKWCRMVSIIITDGFYKECIIERCEKATIECGSEDCDEDPGLIGHNYEWPSPLLTWLMPGDGEVTWHSSTITICTNNEDAIGLSGPAAIHEWAHSCGWDHTYGGGVPFDSGLYD